MSATSASPSATEALPAAFALSSSRPTAILSDSVNRPALASEATSRPLSNNAKSSKSVSTVPAPMASASSVIGFPCVPWIHDAPMSTGTPSEASVLVRPPIRSRASSTVTRTPASASRRAAASPANPAPTIATCSPSARFPSLHADSNAAAVIKPAPQMNSRRPTIMIVTISAQPTFGRRIADAGVGGGVAFCQLTPDLTGRLHRREAAFTRGV